jgi:hypothetical protein
MHWKDNTLSPASPQPALFPGYHKLNSSALPHPSAMMNKPTWTETHETMSQNKSFFPLNYFSQMFVKPQEVNITSS